MPSRSAGPPSRQPNPLWIISLFLGTAEVTMGVAASRASGWAQGLFAVFSIAFPVGVAAAFFAILWKKPYVLYAPRDFGGRANVGEFVAAMSALPHVGELLDLVYFALSDRVRPYSYGAEWVLRDSDADKVYLDMGRDWARRHLGIEQDPRSLQTVGIRPGARLVVAWAGR
ncbi:hypothetical protein Skr01_73120 [Sphaerisporangium krabiense]|uniref:Uncharacterized protein n=1 Tax=Sphaerisporangium krabiense TaxID=763782 RepID=A0A7W8Z944_9ACTN|nr:hypothetical protein [Sphaerisporangium krabiense]MBB5629570.1 hypothetical protein [Sphaerisporangium krabiense]GII67227.1 hypothetical protein Skr01_73120 [Sphaerisporangium krabiense]